MNDKKVEILNMKIEIEDIKEAYNRLKTHVYYDNSDLFIRRKVAEFETNLSSELDIFSVNREYIKGESTASFGLAVNLEKKFEKIATAINDNDDSFFDSFFGKMQVRYLPKKFTLIGHAENVISNKRIRSEYEVERASAFIDVPVELHLIAVLWIMKYGKDFDASLPKEAYGNRLLLNKKKNDLIQGSSLFKPYYKQYQHWRDNAVIEAKKTLDSEENVMFINLDIKDFYYSVNLDLEELHNEKQSYYPNLLSLFKRIHSCFTEKLKKVNFPFSYENRLKENEVILPIGLLSSYVLANYCLKDFDDNVIKKLKPHYYGRYVDDIVFVIKNPNCPEKTKSAKELIFSELSQVLESEPIDSKNVRLIHEKYKNLICQSDKTLLYYFDYKESDLVIDKLKRELEERASEFRDFPEENDNVLFEDNAYHLIYNGSEGKIKTLKDYKENRYGLSVFLSNKIFSALRHNKKLQREDSKKILRFFKGITCLELFRLWEKIFTLFIVNDDADAFVEFYKHTFLQIGNIRQKFSDKSTKLPNGEVEKALLEYLDCSLELSLALNPSFISKNKNAQKKLEFFQNEQAKWYSFLVNPFSEPTNPHSFYITRYRQSNLIRHHYLTLPLISYTKAIFDNSLNLTGLEIPLESYSFRDNDDVLDNSPRSVRFWECCLAIIYQKLSEIQTNCEEEKEDLRIDLFDFKDNEDGGVESYLDEAFDLYSKINENHTADHSVNLKESFYDYEKEKEAVRGCDIVKFQINSENKFKEIVRVSFANTEVRIENIESSIRGNPLIDVSRYNTFQKIFKTTRQEKANILLLPENALPYQLFSTLTRYSQNNSIMVVSGVEHWKIKNYCFNFIVSILPVTVNNTKDAVVLIRLKNHYAPEEKELIRGEHLYCPKPNKYRYDLINWRNLYFSPFYCFELADVFHRSLFKSKVDLIIASEWNKDVPYFSNIVESLSRDIHAYIAQVNTSQYGDSRLTKPSSSATKDILKLKGGKNDTVLIGEIDLKSLRTFQRKNYNQTKEDKEFKPLPPDYDWKNAIKREKNAKI